MVSKTMPLTYGVTQTKYGHEVCILQEDGAPLMTVSKPFSDPQEALQECLSITVRAEARERQEAEWYAQGRRVLMFRLPIPTK